MQFQRSFAVLFALALQVALVPSAAALESAYQLVTEGKRHLAKGEFYDAEEAFVKALEIRPQNPIPHHELGQLLMERMTPPRSKRLIEVLEALDVKSRSAEAYYWLSEAQRYEGKHVESQRLLEKARKIRPSVIPADRLFGLRNSPPDTLKEIKSVPDTWQPLAKLAFILGLALLFVVGLRVLVFQSKGPVRDFLLFLAILTVLAFSALFFGWISGGQFLDFFKELVPAVKPDSK